MGNPGIFKPGPYIEMATVTRSTKEQSQSGNVSCFRKTWGKCESGWEFRGTASKK